ncbi:MAG TPA: putative Ig domain-containing protein, partial [Verrucomicrobiae bacterium]
VVATDDGVPPQATTNTISITVTEANTAPIIDPIADQIVNELEKLTVVVAAHDNDLPAQTLTYSLDTPPPGAAIDAATGVFTWTPTEAQGPGQYTITVRVRESGAAALSTTRTFAVTVNEVNTAPVVQVPTPYTRAEMVAMSIPVTVADSDILNGQTPNTNRLTFTLQSGPPGATINAQSGVISWTPTEAQGPGSYQLRVVATDDGVPALSGEGIITINVTEANRAPSITAPASQTVAELTPLNVTFTATDPDLPTQALTFSVVSAPAGVQLNPTTGSVTWTPTEAQGPGTYTISVAVADNGSPVLRATNSMTVTVTEVNTKPTLNSIPNYTLGIGGTINFQASATDPDIPAQTLTFSLDAAPPGATINPNTGVFIWTPGANQANGPQTVTIRVTESGAAALFDTKTFSIQITGATSNTPPSIFTPPDQIIAVGTALSVTNIAVDTDVPANTLTFSIVTAPTGAAINPSTGVVTWTPTSAQVGQSQFQVRVTDNGVPPLSATNSFSITVTNTTSAPPATLRITAVDVTGTTLRVEGPPNSSYDIEYSTDFTSWTKVTTVSLGGQTFAIYLDTLHGYGQLKGFYRAKSAGGSANPAAPTVKTQSVGAGGLILRVTGDSGFTYTIQFSSDLINWSQIGTLAIATGSFADFTDSAQPTRGSKGFYRAIFP